MLNLIIKKWIEPYKLLETIKEHSSMEEFTFDGTNKAILKTHFLKQLKETKGFGLYMKNVNKFYIFETACNIKDIVTKTFDLTENDYEITEDEHKPFDMIDSGRAEASVITY